MDNQPGHHHVRKMLVGIFLLAVIVYLPNLQNDFAWDDHYLVENNPQVHSFEHTWDWFSTPWASGSEDERGQSQNALYWRPLTQASYTLDWVIGGGVPWVFHLTNDLIHGLCSVAVALLTLMLIGRLRQRPVTDPSVVLSGAIAGGLFALHPVHNEAVHLITYRTTLLATLGVLTGVLFHIRSKNGDAWWIALCYAAGLMAKEDALVLPGVMVVVDLVMKREWKRAHFYHYAPTLWVLMLYGIVHSQLTGSASLDFFAGQELTTKFWTMMKVYLLDLQLLVIPYPLTSFYDWSIIPFAHGPSDLKALTGFLLLLASVGLVLVSLIRGWNTIAVGLGIFLCGLVPYSHLVTFFDVAGERFLYFPSAGFCVAIGMGAAHFFFQGRPAKTVISPILFVSLIYLGLTINRTPHYENTQTLLEETVRHYPESYSAQYELGRIYMLNEDPEAAEVAFHSAYHSLPLWQAGVCYGESLIRQFRPEDAARFFDEEITRWKPRAETSAAAQQLLPPFHASLELLESHLGGVPPTPPSTPEHNSMPVEKRLDPDQKMYPAETAPSLADWLEVSQNIFSGIRRHPAHTVLECDLKTMMEK